MLIPRLPKDDSWRYYVYAMICRDDQNQDSGYIKFGLSGRIGKRLNELRTACPIPARLFAIVHVGPRKPQALLVERALHKRFESRRVTGEWFRFNFADEADKRDFNDGTRAVLLATLGPDHEWWAQISVKALDEHAKAARAIFLSNKRRGKITRDDINRRRVNRAYRELAAYRGPGPVCR